jgi:HD-GYP domain-containing protein (c-di-GMP phosphodiesterase class II)
MIDSADRSATPAAAFTETEPATASQVLQQERTELSCRLRALKTLNTKLICMSAERANYQEMVHGVWKVIGCDACALYLYDPHRDALLLTAAVGYDVGVDDYELTLARDDRIHVQAFREEYLVHVQNRIETPELQALDDDVRSCLVLPIISNDGPVGVFDFGSHEPCAFAAEDVDICSMLVDQLAYSLENIRLLGELRESRDAVIRGMALLAESRDENIGGHLDRICASSRMLAGRLLGNPDYQDEVDIAFVETIARAAALHDIGKVGIPDMILLKPGKLTDAEFGVMKSHTTLGFELLSHLMDQHGSYYMIRMGADVALAHHEWWDGSGYPQGRSGLDIPLAARIVALADVYDALTSKRIYKEAWSHADALDAIRSKAGHQFDPLLAELFLSSPRELLELRRLFPD